MRLSSRTPVTAFLIAIAVAGLYATRLAFSPIYLIHDEAAFALQAQAVAASGHDLNGNFLPVYFAEPGFPAGRDPLIIYATALALKVLPLSEAAVRLPTALLGVLDVGLMFFLSRRLFGSDRMGAVGALMLAFTPGHFMRSRLILSPIFALPFILAWLLSLERFRGGGERPALVAAVTWLGLGMYSYLACMVMMPLYLVLTWWIVAERRAWPLAPVAAGAFALALVPMAIWHATHVDRYAQIVDAYRLFQAGHPGAEPAASLGLFETLRLRLDLYWSFFDPASMFLSGQSSLVDSTRTAGIFPLALAVFMPVGAYLLAMGRGGTIGRVILIGLLTSPLATVLSGHVEMNRMLFVIPFAVLTALYGADSMFRASHRRWQAVAVVLLVTIPLQFWGFYRHYMGPYRAASSVAFGGNLREALIDVLTRQADTDGAVYLSRRIPYADRYWRFYAIAQGKVGMISRPEAVDTSTFAAAGAPRGAVLVCTADDAACAPLATSSNWFNVLTTAEPDGTAAFAVYQKR